jgi:hypothetical protein
LIPIVLAAVVAVVAMSTTAPGAAALRGVAGKLSLNAQAAGGGGGGGGGVDSIAIPSATLTAKLAVSLTVTYSCRPAFDPSTNSFDVSFSSQIFSSVQERTSGKTVANGSGIAFGNAICNEGLVPTPAVNQATVLVTPDVFPASGPLKKGTALANVQVIACPIVFVASGVQPPCDFGSSIGTIISIK